VHLTRVYGTILLKSNKLKNYPANQG